MSRLGVPKSVGSGFWLHLVGYFIAGALYFLSFGNKRQRIVLVTFIGLFALGVLFEIVQIYVPHRAFNPKDIAANGLGLAGVFVCNKLIGRRQIKA
jgi:VanZ family protein